MNIFLVALSLIACCAVSSRAQVASPLFARGYTVIPYPQQVTLGEHDVDFGAGWQVIIDSGLSPDDAVIQTLKDLLVERFGLTLGKTAHPDRLLHLRVRPSSIFPKEVEDRDRSAVMDQAYEIVLTQQAINITSNSVTGLFYGIETFVQLLRRDGDTLLLPEGQIRDWPDLHLRHIFWDLSHHLEPLQEIKRNIRQAAFYKINGFVLKLDGHFQYQSAPAVVEPYALSPAELQELTDYAFRYHVQLIPYLDGPGHLAFLLKHPEFAGLREFRESNYEICSTNPDSYKLLESMYQDLMDANKGGAYFYLSTDEAYYIGLANSRDCYEKGPNVSAQSPSRALTSFVSKAGDYLHRHGRTVIFWGEYPLQSKDIPLLPTYLVSGEVNGPAFDSAFMKHGIRQLIYTSGEGEELFFPDYTILPDARRLHHNYSGKRRVEEIMSKLRLDSSRSDSNLVGEVNASWSDQGVHPETFWLAYVASASAAWHATMPDSEELASTFYSLFYGQGMTNMARIYQLMSNQAQFYADSWETVPSNARKPVWGDSDRINIPPRPAHDQALMLPGLLDENLRFSTGWSLKHAALIDRTSEALLESDTLISMLHQALQQSQMNRYNLEIYLSIAKLCRQNLTMIEGIHSMEDNLTDASTLRTLQPAAALTKIDLALATAETIRLERNTVLADTVRIWDKSWLPRVSDANGRQFLHVLDDVKDHLPDRTVDMSYLVYRELLLPFGTWVQSLSSARNAFAVSHNLSKRLEDFSWTNLEGSIADRSPELSRKGMHTEGEPR